MKHLALITGASGDIGIAIAMKLASLGFDLLLVGRSADALDRASTTLREKFADCAVRVETLDVCKYDDVKALFGRLKDENQQLHVLVNCAGISGGGITAEISPEAWVEVININLNGTFFVIRETLNQGLMPAGGRIINIASTGGKQGVVNGAPYSASKHGMIGLTKALGLELANARKDITVNAVCPGFVESSMAQKVRRNYAKLWNVTEDEVRSRIENRVPIGRYVQPEEVSEMVGYLTSKQAAAVTAQALNVCGGLGNY